MTHFAYLRVSTNSQNAEILNDALPGDTLIVSEISRLARSTLQVLEIAAKKRISVHIFKNGLVMDDSIQATITATILGLAAQIEREFTTMRTKEALTRRNENGLRPLFTVGSREKKSNGNIFYTQRIKQIKLKRGLGNLRNSVEIDR